MISRPSCRALVGFVALGVALVATACQKVPLLAPSGSTITLTAAATTLPLNGSTDIIAQVLEAGGTPPQDGTLIIFTTTLGSIQPSEAETRGGRVTVKFVAGTQSGTATITASSGGASASGNNAIKIAIGAAAVGKVTADANPATVSASGGVTTITSFVFDINGNPLPGVPVTFATDAGTIAPSVVVSDNDGRAVATLTTNKTAKVTATAGNPSTGGGGSGSGSGSTATTQTATVTVTATAGPSVAITSSTTSPLAGQPVSFTVTPTVATGGNPIQRITVDFGDGSFATLGSSTASVAHTFILPGTYTVTATAIDSTGDRGSGTLIVTVGNRPPWNVTIAVNPQNPQVGQPVVITITTTFPAGNTALVQSVAVDFGDGQNVTLGAQSTATVQHVYQTAGTFQITAVVKDTNGGSSSGSTIIFVAQKPNPSVALTSSKNPATLADQPITFTATVTGQQTGITVDHYEWDFGDHIQRSTTSNSTTHSYTERGTFIVAVTAVMSDGVRTSSSIEQRFNP